MSSLQFPKTNEQMKPPQIKNWRKKIKYWRGYRENRIAVHCDQECKVCHYLKINIVVPCIIKNRAILEDLALAFPVCSPKINYVVTLMGDYSPQSKDRGRDNPNVPLRGSERQAVVCPFSGWLLALNRKKILTHDRTWTLCKVKWIQRVNTVYKIKRQKVG